jgi:hypothetical protein
MGEPTLNESGVVSIGLFVVRPLDSPKTAVLLVYELQVSLGLEPHLQKKN